MDLILKQETGTFITDDIKDYFFYLFFPEQKNNNLLTTSDYNELCKSINLNDRILRFAQLEISGILGMCDTTSSLDVFISELPEKNKKWNEFIEDWQDYGLEWETENYRNIYTYTITNNAVLFHYNTDYPENENHKVQFVVQPEVLIPSDTIAFYLCEYNRGETLSSYFEDDLTARQFDGCLDDSDFKGAATILLNTDSIIDHIKERFNYNPDSDYEGLVEEVVKFLKNNTIKEKNMGDDFFLYGLD